MSVIFSRNFYSEISHKLLQYIYLELLILSALERTSWMTTGRRGWLEHMMLKTFT